MGKLRLTARGPADVGEVWARYTQPRRWAGWAPHLREVQYVEAVVVVGKGIGEVCHEGPRDRPVACG